LQGLEGSLPAIEGKGYYYQAAGLYQLDGYEEDLKEAFLHGLVRVVQEDQSRCNELAKRETLSMMCESGYEMASVVGYLLCCWQQNAIPDVVTSCDQAPGS
jgi:hypothetical protein